MRQVLVIFSLFVFFLPLQSSLASDFDKNQLKQMAQGFDLDRDQISRMIDLLQQTGQITAAQAEKAKEELKNYSDDDVNALKEQAIRKIEGASSAEELMPHNMLQNAPDGAQGSSSDSDDVDYREALQYLGE